METRRPSGKHRKPKRIVKEFTNQVRQVAETYGMDIPEGFTLYGCDQKKGYCCHTGRIVIPLWLAQFKHGRMVQYIAHEIAHAFTYLEYGLWTHGPEFMENMKKLCPEEYWHYELLYKPKLAAGAGISI